MLIHAAGEGLFEKIPPGTAWVIQSEQIVVHFPGGGIALAHIALAGAQNDFVEGLESKPVRLQINECGQFGILKPAQAGERFVKDFAQTVEVTLRRAGLLRVIKAFGADQRLALTDLGDEADIGQLWFAVNVDNVGGFDIAMDEPSLVEKTQAVGQRQAELDTFVDGERGAALKIFAQRLGVVSARVKWLPAGEVVRQLHQVVKIARIIVSPDVQDMDQTGMAPGDGVEILDSLERAFIQSRVRKVGAVNTLNRAIGADDVGADQTLAEGPDANTPQ